MRFLAYTRKTLLETARDWKLLVFTLLFAPCFVFILYGAYGGGNPAFNIAVYNLDRQAGGSHGAGIVQALKEAAYSNGDPRFRIVLHESGPEADSLSLDSSIKKLEKRKLDAVLVLTGDTSKAIETAAVGEREGVLQAPYRIYGDPLNSRYALAAIYAAAEVDRYVQKMTPIRLPLTLDEQFVGSGVSLSDFDQLMPGLLVLSLLNVLFTAGASFIKEIEKGTMLRLNLSLLRPWEMIGGISLIQLLLGLASFALTLGAARICGFEWRGSVVAVLLVAAVSLLAVLGLALISVSFMSSVFDVMTVGMVPYFLVMFFAGLFFPLTSIELFSVGDAAFRLNDILPLSISVSALNQALFFERGVYEIHIELLGNLIVACLYFGAGLWLFRRRHMTSR